MLLLFSWVEVGDQKNPLCIPPFFPDRACGGSAVAYHAATLARNASFARESSSSDESNCGIKGADIFPLAIQCSFFCSALAKRITGNAGAGFSLNVDSTLSINAFTCFKHSIKSKMNFGFFVSGNGSGASCSKK